nr:MAG TPA: hypothetical protein [Caudoviricetes sp.]
MLENTKKIKVNPHTFPVTFDFGGVKKETLPEGLGASSSVWMNDVKQVQVELAIHSSEAILAKKNYAVKKKVSEKDRVTPVKRNMRHKFEDIHGKLHQNEFLVLNNYRRRAAKFLINEDSSFTLLGVYYAGSCKQIKAVSADVRDVFIEGVADAHRRHLYELGSAVYTMRKDALSDAKQDARYIDVKRIRPQKFLQTAISQYISGGDEDFDAAAMMFYKDILLPDAKRLSGICVLDDVGTTVYEKVFKDNPLPKDFLVTLNVSNLSKKYLEREPEQVIANLLLSTCMMMSLVDVDKKDGHKVFDKNAMNLIQGVMKRFTVYRVELNTDTGVFEFVKQAPFNSFIEAFGLSRHKSRYTDKSCIRHLQAHKTELLGLLCITKILGENLENLPDVGFDNREQAILSNVKYWEEHSVRGRYSVVAGSVHTELSHRSLSMTFKEDESDEFLEDESTNGKCDNRIYYPMYSLPIMDKFMDCFDNSGIIKLFEEAILKTEVSIAKSFTDIVSSVIELYKDAVFEQDLDFLNYRKFNEFMRSLSTRKDAYVKQEAAWLKDVFSTSLLELKEFVNAVTKYAMLLSHSYLDENGVSQYVPAFTASSSGRMYEKLGLWKYPREIKESFFNISGVNVDANSCHPTLLVNSIVESHKAGIMNISQELEDELIIQYKRINDKVARKKLCIATGCDESNLKQCINSIYNYGKTTYSDNRVEMFEKKNLGCIERLIKENNLKGENKKKIIEYLKPLADVMKKLESHMRGLYKWRNKREGTREGYVNMGIYETSEDMLDNLTPSQLVSYFLQSEETLLTARTAVKMYEESNGKIKVLSHEHDGLVLSIDGETKLAEEERAFVADIANKTYCAVGDEVYPSKTAPLFMREKYFYSDNYHPYKIIRWSSVNDFHQEKVREIIELKEGESFVTSDVKRYNFYKIRMNNENIAKEKLFRNFSELYVYDWMNKYEELVGCLIAFNKEKLKEHKSAKVSKDLTVELIYDDVIKAYSFMKTVYPVQDDDLIREIISDKLMIGGWIIDDFSSIAEQKAALQFSSYKTSI